MGSGHFQEFEDEYLEAMYEFYEKDSESRVRTGSLAESLRISPASATEMVQRLASKGFLDYVPYKGSLMTEKGLEHGKMMKRRHRLAEVLLNYLPFEGNQHHTACRLEHAITDELDLALSVFVGNPTLDPSGRDIPEIKDELKERLSSATKKLCKLNDLKINNSGTVSMLISSNSDLEIFNSLGLAIGTEIINDGNLKLVNSGQILQLTDSMASKIVLDLI